MPLELPGGEEHDEVREFVDFLIKRVAEVAESF